MGALDKWVGHAIMVVFRDFVARRAEWHVLLFKRAAYTPFCPAISSRVSFYKNNSQAKWRTMTIEAEAAAEAEADFSGKCIRGIGSAHVVATQSLSFRLNRIRSAWTGFSAGTVSVPSSGLREIATKR